MNRRLYAGLAVGLAVVMTACGGGVSLPGDVIQGKVTRTGGSAAGTLVIACNVADECQTGGTAQAAADGNYRISGLKQGQQYVILALLDVNGDEQPDYGGVYGTANEPTPVTPPKTDVNFSLSAAN